MKSRFSFARTASVAGAAIGVALIHVPRVMAAPTVVPTTSATGAAGIGHYLHLTESQSACKMPLTLKTTNASVEEVAVLVQKHFAASPRPFIKTLPVIVRKVQPVRLTFDTGTSDSTVGGLLSSVATLSNAKLWVFDDHLLIAPPEALSAEERDSDTFAFGEVLAEFELRCKAYQAFCDFLGTEIQTGRVPFERLSPEAQDMIRELVSYRAQMPNHQRDDGLQPLKLSSGAIVSINPEDRSEFLSVEVPRTATASVFRYTWSDNGWGGQDYDGTLTSQHRSAARPASPFLDPSANRS